MTLINTKSSLGRLVFKNFSTITKKEKVITPNSEEQNTKIGAKISPSGDFEHRKSQTSTARYTCTHALTNPVW